MYLGMKSVILFVCLLLHTCYAEYQDEPAVCEDPNEELKSCGTACEPTCANQDPVCTKQCILNECQCKKGYVRRSDTDRTCVKKSACTPIVGATCATLQCNFNEFCLQKQIFCYLPPCPQPPAKCVGPDDPDFNYGCGINEKRFSCGTACEPSCKVPDPQICTLQCLVNVCQCEEGAFRDETTKQCVKKCPATGTKPSKPKCKHETKNGSDGEEEVEGSPGTEPTGRTCADFLCYPGFECQQLTINCIRAPCPQPEPQCVPKGFSSATVHKTNIVPYTGDGSSSPSQGTSSYFATKTDSKNGETVTYTNNNGKKSVTHSKGPSSSSYNTYTSNGGSVSTSSVRITSNTGGSGSYPAPPTTKCGKNEFFDMCGGCSDLCKDADLLCPALCRTDAAQCRCLAGFRRLNGKCIPVDQCPPTTPTPPTCGPNEFYNQCAGGCPDTCDRLGKPCPDICIGPAKCACRPRFCRRTPGGPCVVPPPGPPTPSGPSTPGPPTPSTCGPNEFYNQCAGGCPDTCDRFGKPCPDICIGPAKCSCRPRLCRRTPGGACVVPPPGPPTPSGPSTPGPPTPAPTGGNDGEPCDCPKGFKCYQPPAACRPPFLCLFVVPKCIPIEGSHGPSPTGTRVTSTNEGKPKCIHSKADTGSYDKRKKV